MQMQGKKFSWLNARLAGVHASKGAGLHSPQNRHEVVVMKCCRDFIGGIRDVDNDWLLSQ
jgi:hypothetical protein